MSVQYLVYYWAFQLSSSYSQSLSGTCSCILHSREHSFPKFWPLGFSNSIRRDCWHGFKFSHCFEGSRKCPTRSCTAITCHYKFVSVWVVLRGTAKSSKENKDSVYKCKIILINLPQERWLTDLPPLGPVLRQPDPQNHPVLQQPDLPLLQVGLLALGQRLRGLLGRHGHGFESHWVLANVAFTMNIR